MSVIALQKNTMPPLFPNKNKAQDYIKSLGKDINAYEFFFLYREMARKKFAPAYKKNHRKLALEYYHRNREKINEKRREKYRETNEEKTLA